MNVYALEEDDRGELRQSGLGIASFIISLLGGFALFGLVCAATYLEMTQPGGLDEDSGEMVILVLLLLGGGFAELIALGLGIAALFQTDRKRTLAVLGIVFAVAALLGLAGLMVLGSMEP